MDERHQSPEPSRDGERAYCVYPPCRPLLDFASRTEENRTRYVVKDHRRDKFFKIGETEYRILLGIDGAHTLDEMVESRPGERSVSRRAVITFLQRLDSLGLLERGGTEVTHIAAQETAYFRKRLFDPDSLLASLNRKLNWSMTRRSVIASFALMAIVGLGLLLRADEVAAYAAYTYREYGIVPLIALILSIAVLHEFAHGLACKHFGGEVRDIGVLMIFRLIPAFYCNVSDLHRLSRRSERLWVIFAGIYLQLVTSAIAGGIWLLTTPYTMIADLGFLTLVAGTLNLLVNCNPLIKLDGYYALSQLIGIDNLQRRSYDYVKGTIRRFFGGSLQDVDTKQRPRRRALYWGYWICSVAYSITLVSLIISQASDHLINWLGFAGVLLTIALVLLAGQTLWGPIVRSTGFSRKGSGVAIRPKPVLRTLLRKGVRDMEHDEGRLNDDQSVGGKAGEGSRGDGRSRLPKWATRMTKPIAISLALGALVAPWEASTGSDCRLELLPGREGSARANVDAVLSLVYAQPGDTIAEGARIAQLSSHDIEDRLTQLNAEIDRLEANALRIDEELLVRRELTLSADLKERDRRRLADELNAELDQIARAGKDKGRADAVTDALPATVAALQSEIELKQLEVNHKSLEVDRYRKLFEQGLVGSQQYDAAVSAMKIGEKELARAQTRLEAALVEHRRLAKSVDTSSQVAETEARAARSNFDGLLADKQSNSQQIEALKHRRDLLRREYEGMTVVAPRAGVVMGEDLRKMIGRRFNRGEEICRIGDLDQFVVRVDVNEREIAEVRLDSPVRFKLKTMPGRTFTGRVSKINSEPVVNELEQRFYAVEALVDNNEGMLRPGMSGFARISFGRQPIFLILADKVWQALRPELWLF